MVRGALILLTVVLVIVPRVHGSAHVGAGVIDPEQWTFKTPTFVEPYGQCNEGDARDPALTCAANTQCVRDNQWWWACRPIQPYPGGPTFEEIMQLENEFNSVLWTGPAEATAAMFTDDAVIFGPGTNTVNTTPEARLAFFTGYADRNNTMVPIPGEAKIKVLDENTFMSIVKAEVLRTEPGATEPIRTTWCNTMVVQKTNGTWKAVYYGYFPCGDPPAK